MGQRTVADRMATKPDSVTEVLEGMLKREHSSGVRGAICLDRNGFTLGSIGELLPVQPAHIVGVAEGCAKLEPGDVPPVITIETNMKTVSVQSQNSLVIAISRKPNQQ